MIDLRDFEIVQDCRLETQEARQIRFATNVGPLTISSPLPGVFRLTLGQNRLPDYGLVDAPPTGPLQLEEGEGGWIIRAGSIALGLAARPLRIALLRGDETILRSITDEHFRGWTRLPAFARGASEQKGASRWLASFALDSDDAVYGFGEKFGPLNRRGQLIVNRNEDALGVNTELSYKNIPFGWSPQGWGVLVNTPASVTQAVGYPQWSHRSYAMTYEDGALDIILFACETPAQILDLSVRLTGRPALPPEWSFGVWLSRAYYKTKAEALEAAAEVRKRRIPCDVITLDGRAWLEVRTRFGFKFDETRYHDPKAALARLKSHGLRVCAWEYPYISIHNPLFQDLADKGYLLKTSDGAPLVFDWDIDPATSPFGNVLTPLPPSGILDFSHRDAYAWWADQHQALFELGIDVMKTDFGEQVPDHAVAANGDSGRRFHNVFARLYNQCVFEATERHFGKGQALVWGRDGWIGSQCFPVQWGGDPQSDWEGFAASIRGGLSYGLSGVPYWSTDVGGFYGKDQPGAELFLRWVAAGIFCSHFRFHGIGAREPWAFGEQAETLARQWLEFRYRLLPYIQGAAEEAMRSGLPLQRAMALAFPQDRAAAAYDLQYMFGPALLVAPITKPGGHVQVWLPRLPKDERWFDIFTGQAYQGGQAVDMRCGLDRLPVFGREGHVLVLGPVVQHTGELTDENRIDEAWVFGAAHETPCVAGGRVYIDGPDRLGGIAPQRIRRFV